MKHIKKYLLILIILTSIIGFFSYPHLPNQIPAKYNDYGTIVSYYPSFFIFLPIIVTVILYITSFFIRRFILKNENADAADCIFFITYIIGLLSMIIQLCLISVSLGISIYKFSAIATFSIGLILSAIAPFSRKYSHFLFFGGILVTFLNFLF